MEEKLKELVKKFPVRATVQRSCENVAWGHHVYDSINSYWIFDASALDECIYVKDSFKETKCIDTTWNAFCESCLETSDSINSSSCSYSQYLARCRDMWYSFNCGDCHNCFGCFGLANKEYCIFNVQLTEEEYNKKLPELKKMPVQEVVDKVKKEVEKKFPIIHSNFSDNKNSEYVDYVYKSNNAYYCFDCIDVDNCYYCTTTNESSDCIDCSYIFRTQHSANSIDLNECYGCYECRESDRCTDCYFSINCQDCSNCFACVNLSHKQYCIYNIQYAKDEYKKKLAEIKNEMGLKFLEPTNQA